MTLDECRVRQSLVGLGWSWSKSHREYLTILIYTNHSVLCVALYHAATCTPPCENGGKCIHPNTCNCPSTWSGSRCQQPVCSPSCQNRGECIRPNTCRCPSGWTGSRCQEPVCLPLCRHQGTCVGPNTCNCPRGWTGALCQDRECPKYQILFSVKAR
jgi:hypothetical protein